jgi:hypothetical protein
MESETKQYLGVAAMAAKSEKATISARYPMSWGGADKGKWTSASKLSMDAT